MKRLSLLLFLQVLACRTTQDAVTPKAGDAIRLTIVGTNDVHGWVMPQLEHFPSADIRHGGLAALSSYLKVLRADNPGGVVLVDAGDLFQGTLMSNITEGQVVIEGFNLLHYDAAAIGNHEFDYGPVGPVSASRPGMDPFGALKARIAQARFPLLSTNIYEADSGLRPSWLPGDGSVIVERAGLKVGIMGLTTPQTPTTTLPINVASLKFGRLAPEALTTATALRKRGADLVVAVVHAGGKCGSCDQPHDLSTCDTGSGEIFEMMKGLPEGTLDAVVAGHTHQQIGHFVNGTPIIESFALGNYLGLIELYVDPATKKVRGDKTQIHAAVPVCETMDEATQTCDTRLLHDKQGLVKAVPASFRGVPIVPDEAVIAAMAPAKQRVAELQDKELGLAVPSALGRSYEAESPLGSFLADSLRAMTKADVALLNPGGLRADLKRGALRYGAVYEVIPFDNQIASLDLTGEELTRLLGAAYGSKKGVFQLSGLEVTIGSCPAPDRLKSVRLPGGKPVDPAAHYRLVMPDFLARGGDGLGPVLATIDPARVDLGDARGSNLRDELVTFWQEQQEAFKPPAAGRVTVASDGPCK